ncbi:MAG: helix-turn-helix transcriptional regulator [Lachnospiraceae bacterium]|jgi:transcriptional regulator with XRE-family HTH domain|nr:helix-turn-helix transcriptional regulator [Lachnospiraceae bacterium]
MSEFREFLNEQLEDPEFRKEYENLEPEFDIIRAMIEARKQQHITQKELSERTGITQADISRIENGTRNPSLDMLKRLAKGMGMRLRLEFISEQDSEIFNNRGLGKQRDFGK